MSEAFVRCKVIGIEANIWLFMPQKYDVTRRRVVRLLSSSTGVGIL